MTDWPTFTPLPADLVTPVRLDPTGVAGPTRGQARGPRWRRSAQGWYVPADVDQHRVEQRILEQGTRLLGHGAVTGWASLRWRGATFFDGRTSRGDLRPVTLIRRSGGRPEPDSQLARHQLAPTEVEEFAGLPCTTVQRALFDEARFAPSLRAAVVSIDMAAAAGLITPRLFALYVARRRSWEGVPLVRDALPLAVDTSRSPQESWLRLTWVLDAGLPAPVCNQPVFSHRGELLGIPDLLDTRVGLVVEYDGAHHRSRDQHRRDVAREHRFREHGLEYAAFVAGDLRDRNLVLARLSAAYRRAEDLATRPRGWTVAAPPWWRPVETFEERLRRLGLAERLVAA